MTVVNRFWASPSGLKAYLDCPRRASIKGPPTPEMKGGLVRHHVFECHYAQGGRDLRNPDVVRACAVFHENWAELEPGRQQQIVDDIVSAAVKPGFLPDLSSVISCEGRGLPKHLIEKFYGHPTLVIPLWPDAGVRCRMDLVCWTEAEPDVCVLPDFKGRSLDDWTVSGMIYAVCANEALADYNFRRFRFEALYIGANKRETYEYEASQMDEYKATLHELVCRMRDDRERLPRLNKWCRYCTAQADCSEYTKAVTEPAPVATVQAAQEFQLPAETGDLIEYREKLAIGQAVLDALYGRVNDKLKERLAAGPVPYGGQEWLLREQVQSYDLHEARAVALADRLGIPIAQVAELRHAKMAAAVKRHRIKLIGQDDAQAIEQLDKEWEACRVPKKHTVIAHRRPKVKKGEPDAGNEPDVSSV